MVRTVTFGGRDWSLGYYAKTNAATRAQQTAVDRGRHRACAHRHHLRPVRLCRLQQFAAQPRNPGTDRLRAAADRRHRRAQPPGQEHPGRDPVDRDAHAAPRLGHRCLARASDRPHPCDVERRHAAQRKPVAGRQAEGTVRVARDPACRPHRGERPGHRRQRARRAERCRCCSSNWLRIPTKACRWSASIRISS